MANRKRTRIKIGICVGLMSQIVVLCPVSIDEIANLTFFYGIPSRKPSRRCIFIRPSARGLSRGYRHSRGHKSNTSWYVKLASFQSGKNFYFCGPSTRRCDLDMGRKWWSKRFSLVQKDNIDVFLALFVEFGQSPQFRNKTSRSPASNRRNFLLGDFSGKVA